MKRALWLSGLLGFAALAAVTPNMLLNKPVSGDTNYAAKIDTILNQIDSHDHTTGKGAQVGIGGIATGAITSAVIAPHAVGTLQLALGSVTTQILADEAVTYAKLADGSVGSGKIDSGVVGDTQSAARQIVNGDTSTSSANDYVQDSTYSLTSTTNLVATDTGLMLVMFGRGKPIELGLVSNGGASAGYLEASGGALAQTVITITKSGTNLFSVACGGNTIAECPLGLKFEDPSPGGNDTTFSGVTYKVQMKAAPSGTTASLVNARFTGTMKR